ncbi:MAG: site-2 protease family protein [archaeon]
MSKHEFSISGREIKEIALALVALSFAFSFVLFGSKIFSAASFAAALSAYPSYFVQSLVAVGIGFVLHEMGHKFVAQRKGLWAEFRAWPLGLALAVGLALFSRGGFVFAAPGAVMISPVRRTESGVHIRILKPGDEGKISIIGSVINVILAALFSLLALATGFGIFAITAQVNAWLALFNMIPVSMLDGAKVFRWNPAIWIGFTALCGGLWFLTVML